MIGRHECLIGGPVLVHCPSHGIPGLRLGIRWPSGCHGCYSILDLGVEASAKLDYDGFWVRVARVSNQVLELIQVVI